MLVDAGRNDINPLALSINPCVAAGVAISDTCVLSQARKDAPLQTASIR